MKKEIVMFTDGSAIVTGDKRGGAGVYIASHDKCISIGHRPTKTGREEARAILIALQQIKDDYDGIVRIYSDSQYCVRTLTMGWLENWEIQCWHNRKNSDLWKQILEEKRKKKCKIIITHIKGHQKDLDNKLVFGNSVADYLADYKCHKEFIEEDPTTWEIG